MKKAPTDRIKRFRLFNLPPKRKYRLLNAANMILPDGALSISVFLLESLRDKPPGLYRIQSRVSTPTILHTITLKVNLLFLV